MVPKQYICECINIFILMIGFTNDFEEDENKEEAEKLALKSFQKIIALRYFNKN